MFDNDNNEKVHLNMNKVSLFAILTGPTFYTVQVFQLQSLVFVDSLHVFVFF